LLSEKSWHHFATDSWGSILYGLLPQIPQWGNNYCCPSAYIIAMCHRREVRLAVTQAALLMWLNYHSLDGSTVSSCIRVVLADRTATQYDRLFSPLW